MKPWNFSKYSGAGNDFILMDGRGLPALPVTAEDVRLLCARHTGVGADGVIFLVDSRLADFGMRVFNSDGSEAAMCGNGLRCAAQFARELGVISLQCSVEVSGRVYHAFLNKELVSVVMPPPKILLFGQQLQLAQQPVIYDFLDTGAPHAVLFVEQLERCPVVEVGAALSHHGQFRPAGTNVTFVEERKANTLSIRTFEKGVGGETLACGTGAVAASLAAAYHRGWEAGQLAVQVRSGDCLTISFSWKSELPTEVEVTGPAYPLFRGRLATNAPLS